MGMFSSAGQAVDDFFGNIFKTEPEEWEKQGFDDYEQWWEYMMPDINQYKSHIDPGGFDKDRYEADMYEWRKLKPL